MDALKKIVIGVAMPETRPWNPANLDAATRIAVRQGFQLANSLKIPVVLTAVLPEVAAGFFQSEEEAASRADQDQAEAGQVLQQMIADSGLDSAQCSSLVSTGQAWLELLKAGEAARSTLTICGTRRRSTISRLLFGGTGMKLLRNAPGPVWLVKPRIDDDAELDVLAATDLSEVGYEIVTAGVTLGRSLPVRLTVMHVVEAEFERQMSHSGASPDELEEWRNRERAEAEERLVEQLSETDCRTLPTGVQSRVTTGDADVELLTAIRELDCDLLIMSSSGRGGIPGVLFGNTAERLLPELPCSLLVVKPTEFQCPVSIDL